MPDIDSSSAKLPRFDDAARDYDALLVLSFGGPEGMDDVVPFLENVTRGRGVPPERLTEVAEHYYHFEGISPINAQNRALIAALEPELAAHGIDLPIYFGNRNWHPFLLDTMEQMRADGVQRALVFVTSAFSSYSGCRQYREDLARAAEQLGEGAPIFDKIRVFYNHPGFLEPVAEKLREAIDRFPAERRAGVRVAFTAHSIPMSMARTSAYETQLRDATTIVAELAGVEHFQLCYQSRSGSPSVPWLEPDILDALDDLHANGHDDVEIIVPVGVDILDVLDDLHANGHDDVVVCPIGFVSDHLEVLFDLDEEGAEHAAELGMTYERAGTVGTHPRFVAMIRELIQERMSESPVRCVLGNKPAVHDNCPVNCCKPAPRPQAVAQAV